MEKTFEVTVTKTYTAVAESPEAAIKQVETIMNDEIFAGDLFVSEFDIKAQEKKI